MFSFFKDLFGFSSKLKPVPKNEFDIVKNWIQCNKHLEYFTFLKMCSDLENQVCFHAINRILINLVFKGHLRVTYRVEISKNEYSEESFNSPEDIPIIIFDHAFRPVKTADLDLVCCYSLIKEF